eukprot:CAMPEP_0202372816 /NCGR_PEP_ID=MMETSP1127-20130417/3951_1 /ASSEMBLY_ACC=CAM_ASM_000462 /TAXON_ID=3047 /ORGANISM="Dunaliella tertiolecta, Strain CCMP1320" /LENGTH=65 /DNA_ID=CAMNT_0048969479 /DNA_START=56 /DNA_END=250 /DNA_ORIENTATION=+
MVTPTLIVTTKCGTKSGTPKTSSGATLAEALCQAQAKHHGMAALGGSATLTAETVLSHVLDRVPP